MSISRPRGRLLETGDWGIEASALPPYEVADRERSRVDPRRWFPEPDRRLEIEIGSGKGTFLVQQAGLAPGVNYLGIEAAREFFLYAGDRVRRHALPNVRILHGDATEFLRYRGPDAVAAVIHLYFSDPWPKKRHHKRRVLQEHTLTDFHRVLQDDGELRLVTDHEDLWDWYEALAAGAAPLFTRRAFAPPESAGTGELVGSNYERKFAREGRPFRAMTMVKRRHEGTEARRHEGC